MSFQEIDKLEKDLWEAADQLRANSKLTAAEYSMPVLGLIFLRHATNRFLAVKAEVEPTLPMRGGVRAPLRKEHFQGRSAIFLPEKAQYDALAALPEGANVGQAIVEAMKLIEAEYEALQGVLPKDYIKFEPALLQELLKIFDRDALRKATGDVFGRIYEYFLNAFAMSGAQEGGEYFTPPSIVNTIVNLIEPDHGTVLDPAVGSAGMFVQTGHFLERRHIQASRVLTFFGQEKAETNTRLAIMNLTVHGLEGKILQGNTFYEDQHGLAGKCDFLMANPPFNVDGVDPAKAKNAGRLPWGLPGLNAKSGAVSNGNYLWIQYFYAYLNDKGRAGFVMASSASDAGGKEKAIRESLVRSGHVDVMVAIGTNFFYTRTLPCTLWFFDKGKPEGRKDQVLMLDARAIYRVVNRRIRDFSPEQLANLTAIVWLHRGQTDRFLALVGDYFSRLNTETETLPNLIEPFGAAFAEMKEKITPFLKAVEANDEVSQEAVDALKGILEELEAEDKAGEVSGLEAIKQLEGMLKVQAPVSLPDQKRVRGLWDAALPTARTWLKNMDHQHKLTHRLIDAAEKTCGARQHEAWETRVIKRALEAFDEAHQELHQKLKTLFYIQAQIHWLQDRFPEASYADVAGLCKRVTIADIEASDWSLTPGGYVGIGAQTEEDDQAFEERFRGIHSELDGLNDEAVSLAEQIQKQVLEMLQ